MFFVAMSRAKKSLHFYPRAPISATKIDYDVTYEVVINNQRPYPGFDENFFKGDVKFGDGGWWDGIPKFANALNED